MMLSIVSHAYWPSPHLFFVKLCVEIVGYFLIIISLLLNCGLFIYSRYGPLTNIFCNYFLLVHILFFHLFSTEFWGTENLILMRSNLSIFSFMVHILCPFLGNLCQPKDTKNCSGFLLEVLEVLHLGMWSILKADFWKYGIKGWDYFYCI